MANTIICFVWQKNVKRKAKKLYGGIIVIRGSYRSGGGRPGGGTLDIYQGGAMGGGGERKKKDRHVRQLFPLSESTKK